MKKYYLFIVCLFVYVIQSYSQSDCSTSLPLCTDANSGGVVNGFGIDDFNGRDQSGCLRLGLGATTIETNSFWFKVKLAESGEFGFNIIPNSLGEDWDFAVYGPNPTCGALGTPIACNYSSDPGYTGVGLDPNSGTQTASYDDWMNANAGDEYVVFINQYDGNNAGFSITWEGAVIDNNTDPLDCSILVDLGPDRDLCTGQSTVLNATTFGAAVSYEWFEYNNTTNAFESMVPVQNTATLLVNTTGNYKVKVTDSTTGVVLEDDIVVTIHDTPVANVVNNMVFCDTDGDGVESFNLESQTVGIINGQANMNVTYHESEIFARAAAAPQNSPYITSGTTIWARIENNGNTDCYDVVSFDLGVVQPVTIFQPPNLQQCDDDGDGFMIFDLDAQLPFIDPTNSGLDITFYEDEVNANDRKGWIINPATYSSQTRTVWVRAELTPGSSCYAITSFQIEVLASVIANTPTNIQQCDDNNDGFYSFDFHALMDADILGPQNPALFAIDYFATQAEADSGLNPLPSPYTNVTPYAFETVYARIYNTGFANCYDTTSFTVQVFDSALPPAPSDIPVMSYCDDISDGDDTNGFYTFNLTDYETLILNGQSPFVFDISYFEDAAYLNQISNPSAFTNTLINGQTIYVRVMNSNPNNTSCYSDTSFDIEVRPLPNAMLTTFTYQQCDEDGVADGVIDFNLNEADTYLSLGNGSLQVTYHLSPIDAAAGINPQNKSAFSNAISPTLFGRVESVNGCYRIVQVDLVVSITGFPPGYSRNLISCDDDAVIDGLHVFDLDQTTSEILALFNAQNLRVSFYRNESDALLESNVIDPSSAYVNETPFNQFIWVRVESSVDGGCYGVSPVIELTVNARPEFDLDETGIVCMNDIPLTVSTYNANGTYTYEWTDESGNVISNQPFAEILQGGIYTVIATSSLGCQSFPQSITISESEIAVITQEDVEINDNSSNNSIRVITDNQNLGIGDYEFSLNESFGPYQDDPLFTQVIPGEHIIYVRDKNGCGLSQITVHVLGFPNFFTPNNDNENDTWQVRGLDQTVFPESYISIYDRYGKLLTTFTGAHQGWDGTYENVEALSSDYWYIVQLVDVAGTSRLYRGHFSLLRK
ncbi:MAG: hypothetical protein BM563_04230 [Bacteroidetes bacterium MedPE-SWsnd-G1]|nr:MAG: hypothetical protein BM563_04230 [Bacteroidetes bacterium MedPE-SWsnd-G1]